jgi:hypothetical protein
VVAAVSFRRQHKGATTLYARKIRCPASRAELSLPERHTRRPATRGVLLMLGSSRRQASMLDTRIAADELVCACLAMHACTCNIVHKGGNGEFPVRGRPPIPVPAGTNILRPRPRQQRRGLSSLHPRPRAGNPSPRGSPFPFQRNTHRKNYNTIEEYKCGRN